MDRVGEATFHLGKSAAAAATLTAPAGDGDRKMEAKRRSVNGVRVVRAGGGKDRHSKVSTARGTRDRRVRLSPKTAILFFDVQERLGCDRPSKALDWLMNEAKPAIDALDRRSPAAADHSTATIELPPPPPPPPLPPSDDCEGKFMADVEFCDANSEIVKLQRFSDCVSSAPLYFPAPANYDSFGERGPLQSSYSRFNYGNSSQFQGYEFVDEDPELAFEQISFLHTL